MAIAIKERFVENHIARLIEKHGGRSDKAGPSRKRKSSSSNGKGDAKRLCNPDSQDVEVKKETVTFAQENDEEHQVKKADLSSDKKYKCKNCEKSYSSASGLSRHRLQIHRLQKFPCVVKNCGEFVSRREQYPSHLKNSHNLSEIEKAAAVAAFKLVKAMYDVDEEDL
jgi:uncharacterized Zn-finger protein